MKIVECVRRMSIHAHILYRVALYINGVRYVQARGVRACASTIAADSSSVLATAGRHFTFAAAAAASRFPLLTQMRNTFVHPPGHRFPHPSPRPLSLEPIGRGRSGPFGGQWEKWRRDCGPRVFSQAETPRPLRRRLYRELNGYVHIYMYICLCVYGICIYCINKLPAGRFKNIACRRMTVVTRARAPPSSRRNPHVYVWPGDDVDRCQGRQLGGLLSWGAILPNPEFRRNLKVDFEHFKSEK